jgi:hypothetical protein
MVSISSLKAKPDTSENLLRLTPSELESLKQDMQSSLKRMEERALQKEDSTLPNRQSA